MVTETGSSAEPRLPLTRDRVLRAAIALADEHGIESLSMRKLGQVLGVEAMSLYNHTRNKDDILDGIVDMVIGEIDVRPAVTDWKASLRQQVMAARLVMLRHPWLPAVIESRTVPTPEVLRHMEAVIGTLRNGGFSLDLAHHAVHVLGSRQFGFNQELFTEPGDAVPTSEAAAVMAREMVERYPFVTEMAVAVSHEGGLGGCDDDVEFAFGLDLILDGLERLLEAS